MATITSYNTTNTIPNLVLSASADGVQSIGSYSMSQLLVNGLNNLALFNSNIAAQAQTGAYSTGTATDGSFYVHTNSYNAFFYGTASSSGSTITKVEIDNLTNGAYLVANGSFTYKGLPFLTTETSGHISNIFNGYKIDSDHWGFAYLTSDVNLVANSTTMSGVITQVSVSELTVSSGSVLGVNYVGTANISVDPFNLSKTTVSSGSITSMEFTAGNTTSVSDSFKASGISTWNINTALNKLALNTNNDTYYLTGSLGQTFSAGSGNDIIYVQSPNNYIDGSTGTDTLILRGNLSDYSLTTNAQGQKIIVDSVAGRDGTTTISNIESLNFANTSYAKLPNFNPIGTVSVTGTATQGQTLTASNTLADADGLGVISYQWQADGSNILGATGSTLVLAQAQVGKVITVVSSYIDGYGTAESVTSLASAKVANVNDKPTGSMIITGTATQGQTLTASNTLADADGLGVISYQWQADGSNILGATGSTLVLAQAQVGKVITVVSSYIDGYGTAESVTSLASAKVANVNDKPTGSMIITGTATQGQTLTASNTLADADGLGVISYQWLRSGQAIIGATGEAYLVNSQDAGEYLSVQASYVDGGNILELVNAVTSLLVLPEITILATAVKGVVSGSLGNDVFDTSTDSAVKYSGGKGDDRYVVQHAGVRITESSNQGIDTVISNVSYTLPLNVENLKLYGDAALTASGNKANNLLVGNSADNLLNGLEGNDTMIGGQGRDTFLLTTPLNAKTNLDTLTDFNPEDDVIGLKSSLFKKLGLSVEQSEIWFKTQGNAQTASQYLVYDAASGVLSYDADASGKAKAIDIAVIGSNLDLTSDNFLIV